MRFWKANAGFTLIEVLIAVLVLSIGLLGAAGVQSRAMGLSREALWSQQAALMGADLIERMRANEAGVRAGAYDRGRAVANANCTSPGGCSPAQLAGNDLFEWDRQVSAQLGSTRWVVCRDSSPDDGTSAAPACSGSGQVYAIKLWLSDGQPGDEQRFVSQARFAL